MQQATLVKHRTANALNLATFRSNGVSRLVIFSVCISLLLLGCGSDSSSEPPPANRSSEPIPANFSPVDIEETARWAGNLVHSANRVVYNEPNQLSQTDKATELAAQFKMDSANLVGQRVTWRFRTLITERSVWLTPNLFGIDGSSNGPSVLRVTTKSKTDDSSLTALWTFELLIPDEISRDDAKLLQEYVTAEASIADVGFETDIYGVKLVFVALEDILLKNVAE